MAQPDLIIVHRDFMPLIDDIKSGFDRDIIIVPIGDGDGYEAWIGEAADSFDFPDFDENANGNLVLYDRDHWQSQRGELFTSAVGPCILWACSLVLARGPVMPDFIAATSTCRSRPCFTSTAGDFHMPQRCWGCVRSIPVAMTLIHYLRLIADEGVTFSHCVPTSSVNVARAPSAAHIDLHRWKVIIGGAALPRGLQDRAAEAGISLHAAYGMSETCPFLTVADLSSDDPEMQAQTGFAGPLVDLRVVTPDMEDVPHDGETTGEVVARAPWLTQGYLDNAQASDALWAVAICIPGDVGYIREEWLVADH